MNDIHQRVMKAMYQQNKFGLRIKGGVVIDLNTRPQISHRPPYQLLPEGTFVEIEFTVRKNGMESKMRMVAEECEFEFPDGSVVNHKGDER